MKKKMKLGVCSALLMGGLVVGDNLGGNQLVYASNDAVNVQAKAVSKFKDVRADHYSYEAILWAQKQGIIHGYEDGTFKPNNQVTEAQFAKMVSEYFGLKGNGGKLVKNQKTEMWHDVYYDRLAAHGVPLNGYFDNITRNSVVKRGTVAQTLAYLGGYSMDLEDSINFLLDNKVTVGQNPAYKNDIFKYFGSQNDLSRAQVVTFLYRMNNNDLTKVGVNAESMFNNSSGYTLNQAATIGKNKIDKSLSTGAGSSVGNGPSIDFGDGNIGKPGVKPPTGAELSAKYGVSIHDGVKEENIDKSTVDYFIKRMGTANVNKYLKGDRFKLALATSDGYSGIIFTESGFGVYNGISLGQFDDGRFLISYGPNHKADAVHLLNSMFGYNIKISDLKYDEINDKVSTGSINIPGGGVIIVHK